MTEWYMLFFSIYTQGPEMMSRVGMLCVGGEAGPEAPDSAGIGAKDEGAESACAAMSGPSNSPR